jgi:hypothetical protein
MVILMGYDPYFFGFNGDLMGSMVYYVMDKAK